jgi:hypothetical protein
LHSSAEVRARLDIDNIHSLFWHINLSPNSIGRYHVFSYLSKMSDFALLARLFREWRAVARRSFLSMR